MLLAARQNGAASPDWGIHKHSGGAWAVGVQICAVQLWFVVQRILVVNTEQFLSLCVRCCFLGRRRTEERMVKLSGSRGHLNKEKMYEIQTGMLTRCNWNISLMALSLPAVRSCLLLWNAQDVTVSHGGPCSGVSWTEFLLSWSHIASCRAGSVGLLTSWWCSQTTFTAPSPARCTAVWFGDGLSVLEFSCKIPNRFWPMW